MAAILLPYNTNATIRFPLVGSATAAFSAGASGSLVGTNVLIIKDGGAEATSTNTGTYVGRGVYQLSLTTSELSAKETYVLVAGSGASLGTVVEVQFILIHTYGSASAMHAFPFNTSTIDANVVNWKGTGAAGTAGTAIVNLVANQSTATIGTVSFLATGTISTVTSVVQADATLLKGTAIAGTQGTLIVNLVANQSTATIGTVSFVATGTISTVTSVVQADTTLLKGTAIAGTQGTLIVNLVANQTTATVGTVTQVTNAVTVTGTPAINLVTILGTAAVATSGTFTNIGTAGTALGTVNADVKLIDGSGTAAQFLGRSAGGIGSGTSTGTMSTTVFETDLTETASDHWKGRIVLFVSGVLRKQVSDVTVYRGSAAGTLGQLTVTTLTTAPVAGDQFVVI